MKNQSFFLVFMQEIPKSIKLYVETPESINLNKSLLMLQYREFWGSNANYADYEKKLQEIFNIVHGVSLNINLIDGSE